MLAMAEVTLHMHITFCRARVDIYVAHVFEGDTIIGIQAAAIVWVRGRRKWREHNE